MSLISSYSSRAIARSSEHHDYELDVQIGYLLRLANQKHLEYFSASIQELTPTQFSVLVRLFEIGELSQNELGRRVGMDSATTNGVVERLIRKQYVQSLPDQFDKRRRKISLTPEGSRLIHALIPEARAVTTDTLKPLDEQEAAQLIQLLRKLLD